MLPRIIAIAVKKTVKAVRAPFKACRCKPPKPFRRQRAAGSRAGFSPDGVRPRPEHAAKLRAAGELDAAEAVLRRALAEAPDDIAALEQFAEVAMTRKHWAEAVARWERVCEAARKAGVSPPGRAYARLNAARVRCAAKLRAAGEFTQAESLLKQVLTGNPGDIEALAQFAVVSAARKDWAEAVSRWEHVLEVAKQNGVTPPEKACTQLNVARIRSAAKLRVAGHLEPAEVLLKQVLSDKPNDIDALVQFAEVSMSRKDWTEAIIRWERVCEAAGQTGLSPPEQASAHLRVARIRHAQKLRGDGELELAEALLEQTLMEDPNNLEAVTQLAILLTEKNSWDKAAGIILNVGDKQLLADSNFAIFAAKLLRKKGDIKNAVAIIQRAKLESLDDITPLNRAIVNEILGCMDSGTSGEVSSSYYDDIYSQSENYKVAGEQSVYLPVWHAVVTCIREQDYRNILDIGCGPGQFAEYLLKQCPNINYTGVDFSKVAIKTARDRCPQASFVVADLLHSDDLLKSEWDVVIILEVLEHIEKDCLLLEKMPEVTNLILSVPNFDSFSHVRFFKNIESVRIRYGPLISGLNIAPVSIEGKSIIFLVTGKKANIF